MNRLLTLLTTTALGCTFTAHAEGNVSTSTVITTKSVSATVISATLVSTTSISATVVSSTAPAPLIVGNGPRNLETTITLAAKHPLLGSSQAGVEQARGTLRAAKGARWFTLTGDAEAGGQFYDDEDADGSAGVGNVGLGFNQPLTDGGRRRGAVLSAQERLSGATDNLEWQQRQRRFAAASAHINLWLAQELVRNNADNVNQLEGIVSEVRGRMGKGEATVTEVAEAETRIATARAAQAERLAALGNAQAAYLRDVGESVNSVDDPGAGVPINEQSTADHPLIAAARHAVEEATGIVKQRASGYWPTLDLRGRASHNAFAGTSRTDPATQGQVTLNLGYTFIDNGVVSGETAAAKAARKAAEFNLHNTELEVDAARDSALSTYTEAERRLSESARAQEESARVIKNLGTEVRQGNRTVRDLLDAKRDQLAATNAWSQAYANRALSSYDLERWQ